MPHVLVKSKRRFEPIVERFDGRGPTTEYPFGAAGLHSAVSFDPLRRHNSRSTFAAPPTSPCGNRAVETSTASLPVAVFHKMLILHRIVRGIGQHVVGTLRKALDLGLNRQALTGSRGICRGQKRKHQPLFSGRNSDFVTVALYPSTCLGVSPLTIAVNASQTFRNATTLSVTLVPGGAQGRNDAFIDRYRFRISQPRRNCFFAEKDNRFLVNPMRASIAIKLRTTCKHATNTQPLHKRSAVCLDKTKLPRLALYPFGYGCHNHHRQRPIGNLGLPTRSGPWTQTFGLLANRNRHFHQLRQTHALLGMHHHSLTLRRGTLLFGTGNVTDGDSCAYISS